MKNKSLPQTEGKAVAKSVAPVFIIGTMLIVGYSLFVRKVILKE